MSMQKTTWDKLSVWSATVSFVVALGAGVFVGFFDQMVKFEGLEIVISDEQITVSNADKIQRDIESLKNQITSITAIPKDLAVSAKLQDIEIKLNDISSQVVTINNAIMQSPEKALEIPMLKRDIVALQNQYKVSTRALEREIGRAYDTIKWVLGTIVFGILGLAASVLLKGKAAEE